MSNGWSTFQALSARAVNEARQAPRKFTSILTSSNVFSLLVNLRENGPTYVGDEYSDPELMQYLCAHKIIEPGNNFSTYVSELNVRRVLDLLENQGYRVVGMSGMGQTCVWTMWKSASPTTDEESDK